MQMPTKAAARVRALLLLTVIGYGASACTVDTTAPASSASNAGQTPSPLTPTGAAFALVGAKDGRYAFTIDPSEDQSLEIGPNHLDIPRNAICRLDDSGYGPTYWDDRCRPERETITITAVVSNASGEHPRIDFEPALRFAPDKTVMLYMTLDKRADKAAWSQIFYCPSSGTGRCVNEAKKDPSLATSVRDRVVFRRIKHFSGYIILNYDE